MMYKTYDNMDEAKKKAIKEDSEKFLKEILWKKKICRKKYVSFAKGLFLGAKNGKKFGMRLNIAQKNAEKGEKMVFFW